MVRFIAEIPVYDGMVSSRYWVGNGWWSALVVEHHTMHVGVLFDTINGIQYITHCRVTLPPEHYLSVSILP